MAWCDPFYGEMKMVDGLDRIVIAVYSRDCQLSSTEICENERIVMNYTCNFFDSRVLSDSQYIQAEKRYATDDGEQARRFAI